MPRVLRIAMLILATAVLAVLAIASLMGAMLAAERGEGGASFIQAFDFGPRVSPPPEPASEPALELRPEASPETPPVEVALAAAPPPADVAVEPLPAAIWESFKTRFITEDGRVVDDANGLISHSEGQGYGMLLAAYAGDAEAFKRLWTWTRTELFVRDDALAAWRWEPDADPHVTDANNATDGDILIAWALGEASGRFDVASYRADAAAIAEVVYDQATGDSRFGLVLMPGVTGFGSDERPDGPVVNLSYWVFPAFDMLREVAPERDWDAVAKAGLALLEASRFGERNVPSDWIALGGEEPRPAQGFEPSFAYNAIRVPLYLAWANDAEREALAPFMALWADSDATLQTIDVKTGTPLGPLNGVGYEAVAALVACAMEGRKLPASVRTVTPDLYYPSVLQALVLIAAEEAYSGCR